MIDHMIPLLQKPASNKKWAGAGLLAAALAIASLPSHALNLFGSDDPDAKEKENQEIDWQLPAPPVAGNLLPFYVSHTTRQSFAIDAMSLTVDTDGIIRYTIIGTSAGGAKNISYEGIRCHSFEKRLYATGNADGTWTRARSSEWLPIAVTGTNLQHAELAQNYLCSGGTIAGKAKQILQTLRYPRPESRQM
jgi:hypothetical protein